MNLLINYNCGIVISLYLSLYISNCIWHFPFRSDSVSFSQTIEELLDFNFENFNRYWQTLLQTYFNIFLKEKLLFKYIFFLLSSISLAKIIFVLLINFLSSSENQLCLTPWWQKLSFLMKKLFFCKIKIIQSLKLYLTTKKLIGIDIGQTEIEMILCVSTIVAFIVKNINTRILFSHLIGWLCSSPYNLFNKARTLKYGLSCIKTVCLHISLRPYSHAWL